MVWVFERFKDLSVFFFFCFGALKVGRFCTSRFLPGGLWGLYFFEVGGALHVLHFCECLGPSPKLLFIILELRTLNFPFYGGLPN